MEKPRIIRRWRNILHARGYGIYEVRTIARRHIKAEKERGTRFRRQVFTLYPSGVPGMAGCVGVSYPCF